MAKANEQTDQKERKVTKGDIVMLVIADGSKAPATVLKAAKDLLDLEFEHKGKLTTITSSPCDPSGTKADSWHLALEKAREDAAASQPQT